MGPAFAQDGAHHSKVVMNSLFEIDSPSVEVYGQFHVE